MTAPSVNFFYAGPGLYRLRQPTDAIYEPLVARQVLNARQWDIQTAKNDALLQTADAYFRVHQSRGTYAGAALHRRARHATSSSGSPDSAATWSPWSRSTGPGTCSPTWNSRPSGAAGVARPERQPDAGAATRPRAVVEPLEHDHAQITLIDPGRSLDDLMPVALTNRPEVAARRALLEAAEARVRREKARPLLPTVMLNGFQTPGGMYIQGGVFGLGPNSSLNQ